MNKIIIITAILSLFPLRPVFASSSAEPYFQYQSYLTSIGYSDGASLTAGSGVIVAVIDQGVWQEHPDLAGNIWNNTYEIPNNKVDDDGNGYVDDYYGWNFVDDDSDMQVYGSHGTHVAGIIAATNNGYGISGIAPLAKIMALTACNASGCVTEDVINAIYYAVKNGADVINLSLGSSGYVGYKSTYDAAIKYAYENNVAVVVSAGNGDTESAGTIGQNLNYIPASPVCNDVNGYNTVIGVGANGSSWSNYGDCVDVTAPGENIIVATVPTFDDGYYFTYADGTSFSAPMVSGAIAAIKSANPDLLNYELFDRIISTETTSGVLNIKSALSTSSFPEITSVAASSVAAGSSIEVQGNHLQPDWDFSLSGISATYIIENSQVTIHDSHSMTLVIPDTVIAGTYKLSVKNNSGKSSSNFTVTASSTGESSSSTSTTSDSSIISSGSGSDVSQLGGQYESSKKDSSLISRLKGSILLQVEEHGEAWYIYPSDSMRYYMKDGATAYSMMRSFGLGITDKDLSTIPLVDAAADIKTSTSVCSTNKIANQVKGTILLQVEQHGEAWYVDPNTCTRVYMKDGSAAYSIMRELGLGITNTDLTKLPSGIVE